MGLEGGGCEDSGDDEASGVGDGAGECGGKGEDVARVGMRGGMRVGRERRKTPAPAVKCQRRGYYGPGAEWGWARSQRPGVRGLEPESG